MPATTSMPATVTPQHTATRCSVSASAWCSGSIIRPSSSSRLFQIAMPPMPPTTTVLASAMPSWISPCSEKIRPSPLIGLRRSNLKPIALPDSSQPPSAIGAASAARPVSASTGASAESPSMPARPAPVSIAWVSKAAARSKPSEPRSMVRRCSPIGPDSIHAP